MIQSKKGKNLIVVEVKNHKHENYIKIDEVTAFRNMSLYVQDSGPKYAISISNHECFIFQVFESETGKADLIRVNQIPPVDILFGGVF